MLGIFCTNRNLNLESVHAIWEHAPCCHASSKMWQRSNSSVDTPRDTCRRKCLHPGSLCNVKSCVPITHLSFKWIWRSGRYKQQQRLGPALQCCSAVTVKTRLANCCRAEAASHHYAGSQTKNHIKFKTLKIFDRVGCNSCALQAGNAAAKRQMHYTNCRTQQKICNSRS